MKTHKILAAIAAVAILAVAAPALAQGGGQGRQGGFGRGGQQASWMLLQRKDVQEDLKITDDQKTKLDALKDSVQETIQQKMSGAGGERPSREEMQKMFAEINADVEKKVDAILTPAQSTRLKEISIQMAGNSIVTRPDVAKALALTDDQQTKIKALQDGLRKAQQALFEKVRSGELDREAVQTTMKKNQDTLNTEIAKILTDDQKSKLKAMGGAPFKRDDEGN